MPETQAAEPQSETTESTAVVAREKSHPVAVEGGVLPILPRNIPEASAYASGLIAANIVPEAFRYSEREARELGDPALKGQPNKSLILMGVLQTLELGVPPQTGLKWLLPLRGRFTIWGDLGVALAQQRGLISNQVTNWIGPALDENSPLGTWPDDFGCEVRLWRKGQEAPYIGKFTVLDAKRAKLWQNNHKQPWIDYPKRMLFNRARAFALRDGFADALSGLDIAEEIMDLPAPKEEAKPAAVISSLVDEPEAPEAEAAEGASE